MTDLLFIEIGAVVTEILGKTHCVIEPFCHANYSPTFNSNNYFEVDFAQLLDSLLLDQTMDPTSVAEKTQYDLILAPMTGRRVQIGPNWPGGGYEGILCIREDAVQSNNLLIQATSKLDGPRYRYQVIASIAADKTARRYHGYQAEVIDSKDGTISFKIGGHTDVFTYAPADSDVAVKFYTGDLVAENIIINASLMPGQIGPVFMNLEKFTATSYLADELPKLPPGAGL